MARPHLEWRPRVGEQVSYPGKDPLLPGERRIGRVWSYEGHTLVAVDLACGIARARFELSDLKPAPQALRSKPMTTEHELTITLTGRPPVRIRSEAWPIIARASEGGPVAAQVRSLVGSWRITVRQNVSGSAIVSAVFLSALANERDRRGGQLVPPGGDIAKAILETAAAMNFPRELAERCIADLPAEVL